MRPLVALDLPGGPAFLRSLAHCLEDGEAFAPIDQRLSGPARQRVLSVLRPTDIIDELGERHHLQGGEPVEDGDLVVVTTSGTTGEPKGVILTEAAVLASAKATSARLNVEPTTDHWLCSLPLNHVGGLSVVLRALLTETAITLLSGFDAQLIGEALDQGASLTSLVPTTLARLGRSQSDRFRKVLLGGSAMPPNLPTNVVTTYGMTESGSGVIYDRQPLDGVEIKIRYDGEITLRCPMLLRAYRNGVDPKDGEGFFHTGDIGSLNEQGELTVFGRSDELIISGGENIWPMAIEQLLDDTPGINQIGVTGIDDPEWGQSVVAIVVKDPSIEINLARLNEQCRSAIGPWAVIRKIITVENLPRTSIGKLDRKRLAELGRSR